MPLSPERTTISDVASGRCRSSCVHRRPGKDFDLVKPREILTVVCINALHSMLDHHRNYESIKYRLALYLVSKSFGVKSCNPALEVDGTTLRRSEEIPVHGFNTS